MTKTFREWFDMISDRLAKAIAREGYTPNFVWNNAIEQKGKDWVDSEQISRDEFVDFITHQTGLPYSYRNRINKWFGNLEQSRKPIKSSDDSINGLSPRQYRNAIDKASEMIADGERDVQKICKATKLDEGDVNAMIADQDEFEESVNSSRKPVKSDLNVEDEAAYWDGLEDAACGLAPADEDDPSYMKGYRNGKKRSGRKSYADKIYDELASSRRITSSQKGYENVVDSTVYDDYHIDTTGQGILDVEHIINEIEDRGNQAVLTVQTSDGRVSHTQFNAKDWKEYKDAVNGVDEFSRNSGTKGAAITDVWVTEVKGGSYVRNSRKAIKSSKVSDIADEKMISFEDVYSVFEQYGYEDYKGEAKKFLNSDWEDVQDKFDEMAELAVMFDLEDWSDNEITSARFLVEDENGEVIGEADTYEEAESLGGAIIVDSESQEMGGQEDMGGLFQSKNITSANNYGWEVDSSEAMEALDMFVEYVGEDTALEELAKSLGENSLEENLEWVCRQWGFLEEIEDLDVWEQFETAKEYMGVSELLNNLSQAIGYDELSECMAYIFRMYDFREWDERNGSDEDYEDEEDDEITNSRSFPVKTVKAILSGRWSEEQAVQNIADKQNVNTGYARQILSSWIDQYKPKLIKSGILDIAEDINTEFDIDGDLESWGEQYTNDSGKSNTVGGEMVRAANQIIYRYNNDGDMIGRGYGNESINAAARYITEKAEMGVNEQIQKWLDHEERADDNDYYNFIETFTTEIEQILRENPELFQKPNKDDFWDWKEDDDMNYGLDECYLDDGNGNQYWFQLDSGDRWYCTGIELDPYSITYSEGDRIYEDDEYVDEIDPTEEFGSFEANGFIYEYAGDDFDDEKDQYVSWQVTKVTPVDPYCDEGDTFDFYDFEPDELMGYTLYDHNGNEIDERTFLASSLIKSNITSGDEVVIEIERHGKWEIVAQSDDERGWTLKGDATPAIFDNKADAKNSQLAKDLARDGYSPNQGNMRFKKYS